MPRFRKTSLRGSVTQQTPSVRLRGRRHDSRAMMVRFGAVGGALAVLILLAAWLWIIGWPQKEARRLAEESLAYTQKAHFAVTDIQVDGRRQTSRDELMQALGLAAGSAIFAFDPAGAAARIAKLPWVSSVTVERRLPDAVHVNLVERSPLARWQHGGKTIVIDSTGAELPGVQPEQFSGLPLVVGAGAASQARTLLETLKDYPDVAARMTAAVWVGLRRWDIYLPPKVVAKLPEGDLAGGLGRLARKIAQDKILDRDIVGIDLRFPGREVLEPANPAASNATGDSP